MGFRSIYFDPEKRHIPRTLSELEDFVASLFGGAPTFIDDHFDFQNIDTEFDVYNQSLELVRKKLGEERYARLVSLGAQAKALFAADPEDTNGKTEQGFGLLKEIDDILHGIRSQRVKARLADEEGEVTGD
jgi:hypothetical protein